MKALTKPEKFQAMSRIYGYLECEGDKAPGTEVVKVQHWWGTEYQCVETCAHQDHEC